MLSWAESQRGWIAVWEIWILFLLYSVSHYFWIFYLFYSSTSWNYITFTIVACPSSLSLFVILGTSNKLFISLFHLHLPLYFSLIFYSNDLFFCLYIPQSELGGVTRRPVPPVYGGKCSRRIWSRGSSDRWQILIWWSRYIETITAKEGVLNFI